KKNPSRMKVTKEGDVKVYENREGKDPVYLAVVGKDTIVASLSKGVVVEAAKAGGKTPPKLAGDLAERIDKIDDTQDASLVRPGRRRPAAPAGEERPAEGHRRQDQGLQRRDDGGQGRVRRGDRPHRRRQVRRQHHRVALRRQGPGPADDPEQPPLRPAARRNL